MTQKVIDDIATNTTPQLTMQAIDANFDELYLVDAAVALNTAKETNVSTNLSVTTNSTSVTVVSSDGDNAIIGTATTLKAGAMTAEQVTKLNTASASYTNPWI